MAVKYFLALTLLIFSALQGHATTAAYPVMEALTARLAVRAGARVAVKFVPIVGQAALAYEVIILTKHGTRWVAENFSQTTGTRLNYQEYQRWCSAQSNASVCQSFDTVTREEYETHWGSAPQATNPLEDRQRLQSAIERTQTSSLDDLVNGLRTNSIVEAPTQTATQPPRPRCDKKDQTDDPDDLDIIQAFQTAPDLKPTALSLHQLAMRKGWSVKSVYNGGGFSYADPKGKVRLIIKDSVPQNSRFGPASRVPRVAVYTKNGLTRYDPFDGCKVLDGALGWVEKTHRPIGQYKALKDQMQRPASFFHNSAQ